MLRLFINSRGLLPPQDYQWVELQAGAGLVVTGVELPAGAETLVDEEYFSLVVTHQAGLLMCYATGLPADRQDTLGRAISNGVLLISDDSDLVRGVCIAGLDGTLAPLVDGHIRFGGDAAIGFTHEPQDDQTLHEALAGLRRAPSGAAPGRAVFLDGPEEHHRARLIDMLTTYPWPPNKAHLLIVTGRRDTSAQMLRRFHTAWSYEYTENLLHNGGDSLLDYLRMLWQALLGRFR